MNLYLLRHGIAVEHGAPGHGQDADRPLTDKGERKLWRITEAMRVMELSFDLILASPYLRARRTAEIVAEAFKAKKKLELCNALAADGDMLELIHFLNHLSPRPEHVLVVGHEPYLGVLATLLITGDSGSAVEFKKGGLCKLMIQRLRPGRCATLEWLLTPRQMGLMT